MLFSLAIPFFMNDVQAEESFEGGDFPNINIQNFRPAMGRQDLLWVNETRIDRHNLFSMRNVILYTKDPLSYTNYRGERVRLLNDILETDILASYSTGMVQFGIGVPIYFRALNESTGSQSGIGDIWLDSKVRILDRTMQTVGLAFSLRSTVPTSSLSGPLSTDGVLIEAEVNADTEVGPTLWAVNLGHRQQPSATLENVTWGPQLFAKLGVAYHIDDYFGLSSELYAAWTYADIGNSASSPFEALFGGWRRFSNHDDWVMRAGFGMGLNEAISTPATRAMMIVSYDPIPYKDNDRDGIVDQKDSCPLEAEDMDGVLDDDGCPEPTQVVFTAVDQFGLELTDFNWVFDGSEGNQNKLPTVYGGVHPVQVSAIGHKELTIDIEIPDVETFSYQFSMEALLSDLRVVAYSPTGEELLSAIWSATDKGMPTNIPGGRTERVRVGSNKIVVRAPGFRRKILDVDVLVGTTNEVKVMLDISKARIEQGRIQIEEKVYFGQDSEDILPSSNELLVEVAEVMQDHPELAHIRIEGHTDAIGDEEYNVELSQKRAEAVMRFLDEQGVEPSRMSAKGFGEGSPIGSNLTDEGRAQNRRVEFHVERIDPTLLTPEDEEE